MIKLPNKSPHDAPEAILPIIAIAAGSGFAGLGYEILWTRLLANSLGHEIVAVLGVLAALFGGLALGSLIFGQRIGASSRPGRWYAGLELVIGLWALFLIPLFPLLGKLVPVLMPVDSSPFRQWSVAFLVPSVVLLPATLAMGATLPALERILSPRTQTGQAVGWVYAANTFGAVAGTLATTFLILPKLGLSSTLVVCALINVVCAAAMMRWGRGTAVDEPARGASDQVGMPRPALVSMFLTGLLGIGYEVLAVRTLSQIMENTVYTFAGLLSVYLLGTALGAALFARFTRAGKRDTDWLPAATSLSCVFGTVLLSQAIAIWTLLRAAMPPSLGTAIVAELGLAAAVFLIPTIAMGALFTLLAQAARNRDGSIGPALAANTAGAALAPILFGPILLPLVGAKLALIMVALGYALVALRPHWPGLALRGATAALALALLLSPVSLRFIQVPPGGEVLWHRDGTMAAVSVVQDRPGDRHLEINSHFRMGGTAFIRSDYREAHIPLLLHPDPKRALFLGLGTGTTISAAADYPGLVTDGVELIPEVADSFSLFAKSAPNLRNPNIRIHTADARRYIQADSSRYDVIVADVYHPWIDGAGTLYTREHFAAIRARLAEGGIFCQWLPLHQLDLPTLRLIVRTFLSVYPDGSAYLAQFSIGTPLIGLIGSDTPRKYTSGWMKRRATDAELREHLAQVDLSDDMALFGLYLGDAKELANLAGTGSINTDDNQTVTFNAPKMAYDAPESPGTRLLEVLSALHPHPVSILGSANGSDEMLSTKLVDYWRARDRFLELGQRTLESPSQGNIAVELAPRLIEVVRMSADFDAAYRPVLAMAKQLAGGNRLAARKLLEDLDHANPGRRDARNMLDALSPD